MSDERKGKEGQEEEEFEPLDKFFAPIEDVDFPEEGEGAGPAGDPALEDDLLPGELPADPLAGIEAEAEPAAPVPGSGAPAGAGEPTAEVSGGEGGELRLDVGAGGGEDAEP